MNRFGTLQFSKGLAKLKEATSAVSNSYKATVDTLTSNLERPGEHVEPLSMVSSNGSDLREALSAQVSGSSQGASTVAATLEKPRVVEVPVESAKKLRFWDRADINELVKLHAQEKEVVLAENRAMRRMLLEHHSEAELDAMLPGATDYRGRPTNGVRVALEDAATSSIMLLAAQAELARLQAKLEGLQEPQRHEDAQDAAVFVSISAHVGGDAVSVHLRTGRGASFQACNGCQTDALLAEALEGEPTDCALDGTPHDHADEQVARLRSKVKHLEFDLHQANMESSLMAEAAETTRSEACELREHVLLLKQVLAAAGTSKSSQISTLEDQRKLLALQLGATKSSAETLKERVVGLKAQLEELRGEKSQLEHEVTGLATELEMSKQQRQQEVAELQTHVLLLKKVLAGNSQAMHNRILEMRSYVKSLEVQLDARRAIEADECDSMQVTVLQGRAEELERSLGVTPGLRATSITQLMADLMEELQIAPSPHRSLSAPAMPNPIVEMPAEADHGNSSTQEAARAGEEPRHALVPRHAHEEILPKLHRALGSLGSDLDKEAELQAQRMHFKERQIELLKQQLYDQATTNGSCPTCNASLMEAPGQRVMLSPATSVDAPGWLEDATRAGERQAQQEMPEQPVIVTANTLEHQMLEEQIQDVPEIEGQMQEATRVLVNDPQTESDCTNAPDAHDLRVDLEDVCSLQASLQEALQFQDQAMQAAAGARLLESELECARRELAQARATSKQAEADVSQMRAELDKALLCTARSEGEASKHMGLVVGLETERDESLRLLKSLRAQVDALKAQLQEAQVEAVEAQAEYSRLQHQHAEELEARVAEHAVQCAKLQKEIISLEERTQALARGMQAQAKAADHKEKDLEASWREQIQSLQSSLAQSAQDLSAARAAASASMASAEEMAARLRRRDAEEEERAAQLAGLRQRLEAGLVQAESRAALAERESEELRVRLALLEDQIADQKHEVRNMEAYKHRVKSSEAAREQAEADLMVTTELAASLEVKMQASKAEMASVQLELMRQIKTLEEAGDAALLQTAREEAQQSLARAEQWEAACRLETEAVEEARQGAARAEQALAAGQATTEQLTEQAQELRGQVRMWQRRAEAEAALLEGERHEWRDRDREHSARVGETEASLAAMQAKYSEMQDNFMTWRRKARSMMEAQELEVKALQMRVGGTHSEPPRSPASTGQRVSNRQMRMFLRDDEPLSDTTSPVAPVPAEEFDDVPATQKQRSDPTTHSASRLEHVPDTAGVDVLYLKNVLVKFLEIPPHELVTRKRLRPVLSLLLQLSPEEDARIDNSMKAAAPTTGWLW